MPARRLSVTFKQSTQVYIAEPTRRTTADADKLRALFTLTHITREGGKQTLRTVRPFIASFQFPGVSIGFDYWREREPTLHCSVPYTGWKRSQVLLVGLPVHEYSRATATDGSPGPGRPDVGKDNTATALD